MNWIKIRDITFRLEEVFMFDVNITEKIINIFFKNQGTDGYLKKEIKNVTFKEIKMIKKLHKI